MGYKVILISGKQGAGKSTTAEELRSLLLLEKKRVLTKKFADPLYTLQGHIFRAAEEVLGIQVKGTKDGDLLQHIGEWGRKRFGADVWVSALKRSIASSADVFNADFYIIDDCRFENEFDAFPDAFKVRLEAAESVRRYRTNSWRDNTNHPSEVGLDKYAELGKFDMVIHTDKPDINAQLTAKLIFDGFCVWS